LPRHQAQPGGELAARAENLRVRNRRGNCSSDDRPNARNAGQPLTHRVGLVPGQQLPLQRCNRRLDLLDLICQHLQHLPRRVRQARIAIVAPRLSFFRSSNASALKHQSSGSCLFSSIVTKNFCCASASILPANLVPVCEFVCRPTILPTEQEYLPTVGDGSSPKTTEVGVTSRTTKLVVQHLDSCKAMLLMASSPSLLEGFVFSSISW